MSSLTSKKKEGRTAHALRGKNLTSSFFDRIGKYRGAQQSSSFYSSRGNDDQGKFLVQKEQAIMLHY